MGDVGPGRPPVEHQFKPGQSGNPAGKKPGTRSLATLIRELENEDYDWSLIPIKNKELAQKFGAPWKAIIATALAKAYSGDTKAMQWLQRSGYGDKMDITTDGQPLTVIYRPDKLPEGHVNQKPTPD